MTELELLKEIANTLLDIKELLAKQQTAAPTARPASSFSTPSAAQAEIPQPTELVDNPGDVQVHYGKNNGVALSKLSERSAEWYAQEQPPKMDSSGRPYPERPQERVLKNAARQLYHTRKGTLAAAPAQAQGQTRIERNMLPSSGGSSSPALDDDQSIPFAARWYDHG